MGNEGNGAGGGRTVVVSGGTDGMGRELALARLRRGDTVVVIGSSEAKGAAMAAEAARTGAADRFRFLPAELSSIAEAERVVGLITESHRAVDALVLCANRIMTKRQETAEGLEYTFALYYLSRYLLGHGLRAQLDAAPDPVIINFCAPGITAGQVHFDDLQLERKYGTIRAQTQCGRANDLLSAAFAEQPSSRARYVMYHPGFTATTGGLAHLRQPVRGLIALLGKIAAKPVDRAVAPMVELIDAPPSDRWSALDRGKPVDRSFSTFDPAAALRLAALTRELVTARTPGTALLPPTDPIPPASSASASR